MNHDLNGFDCITISTLGKPNKQAFAINHALKNVLFAGAAFSSSVLLAGNPILTDVFTAAPAPLLDGDTVCLYT